MTLIFWTIPFHHVDKKEGRNWLLTKSYFMISRAGVLFSGIKDKKSDHFYFILLSRAVT